MSTKVISKTGHRIRAEQMLTLAGFELATFQTRVKRSDTSAPQLPSSPYSKQGPMNESLGFSFWRHVLLSLYICLFCLFKFLKQEYENSDSMIIIFFFSQCAKSHRADVGRRCPTHSLAQANSGQHWPDAHRWVIITGSADV